MRDRKLFNMGMYSMAEVFGKELTELLMGIYWKCLDPYSDADCERAFSQALVTCTYFPRPAELIRFMAPDDTDSVALLAWADVLAMVRQVGSYKTVKFNNPVIHSCIEAMGGWPAIGAIPNERLSWAEKEFVSLYKAMKSKRNHPHFLRGLPKPREETPPAPVVDAIVTRALPGEIPDDPH